MNKLLCWIVLLAVMLTLAGFGPTQSISAEEQATERATSADGRFEYVLRQDGTAEISKYLGSDEQLNIPSELDGHPVTAIRYYAFFMCRSLKNVTIADGVISIDRFAFAACDSLKSVTIPDSVKEIDMNPFAYCNQLANIIVSPDHPYLSVIDGALISKPDKQLICFPGAFQMETCVIPPGVRIIGVGAFYEFDRLKSVTIPNSVTEIKAGAFFSCSGLKSMTIPESVTMIGYAAFSGCKNLTLTVDRGSYAEQYCKELKLKYQYADAQD